MGQIRTCPLGVQTTAILPQRLLHKLVASSEAAFQHIFTELTNDLLQLRFERGAIQLLRAAGPPCMPELVFAAPEIHPDMADGTQPLIFFWVRGIKQARLLRAGRSDMELCCFFKVMISFRCRIWLYTFLGVCYDVANKSEVEGVINENWCD